MFLDFNISSYSFCHYLYVCYSTNKEDVEYSRVPLKSIALIAPSKPTGINEISSSGNKTIKSYNLLGQQVNENYRNIIIKNGKKISHITEFYDNVNNKKETNQARQDHD